VWSGGGEDFDVLLFAMTTIKIIQKSLLKDTSHTAA